MGKKNIKTPDNFGYGDMPADFRMRYKQMLDEHNEREKEKKKNKLKSEQFAEKLYGGKDK
tara:strand:+ start:219 stop:398 length:180 start_codon:yes stop_codon:yes gene_type:complete